MHFNGNDDNHAASAGSMPTSVTHDEHLNFGGNSDLTNK
jgi:hypothetical protein